MTETINPCTFCVDKSATVLETQKSNLPNDTACRHRVVCAGCQTSGPWCAYEDNAISTWNSIHVNPDTPQPDQITLCGTGDVSALKITTHEFIPRLKRWVLKVTITPFTTERAIERFLSVDDAVALYKWLHKLYGENKT